MNSAGEILRNEQILLVCSNFFPEPTGIAIYSTDLASQLSKSGANVDVLTSPPHYPWWCIPARFSNLSEGFQLIDEIRVLRAKHSIPKSFNILSRLRYETSIFFNYLFFSRKLPKKRYKTVIAYSPSLASAIIGFLLSKKFSSSFGLVVQDLSGRAATQSGMQGAKYVSIVIQKIELFIASKAKGVVVVSDPMRNYLVNHSLDEDKITYIPNYSSVPIIHHNKYTSRKILNWTPDDFIVLHTGNMGLKQDLQNIVKAADYLKLSENIKFVLVGGGNQENFLKDLANGTPNISFISTVSEEEYSHLLSAADLLLLNEKPTQFDMSLPSKITSYLMSGKPVLACVPKEGATAQYLSNSAYIIDAGDPKLCADTIIKLSKDYLLREKFANSGLDFAKKNLESNIGRERYLKWVKSLT